jgi:sugar transferase EpsL
MLMGHVVLMKRALDIFLSFSFLLISLPIIVVLYFCVMFFIGSPPLFRQTRTGIHGQLFVIYKFKNMTDLKDHNNNLLPDSERLTRLGRFLRTTSLDELPELLNVLRGDMSLVGPRPLLPKYLPYYTPTENRRHEVLPGITGWAQIHGRNYLPWQERLAHDVWYVDHQSLRLDLHILWRTLWKVIQREGVSADPDEAETDLDKERLKMVADQRIKCPQQ